MGICGALRNVKRGFLTALSEFRMNRRDRRDRRDRLTNV
jgi:hypothetical protein